MKRLHLLLLTTLCLALPVDCLGSGATYNYQAQTGALSYTFFNLSPNTCYFTNYPSGGANPNAYSHPANTYGWNNFSGTDRMPCSGWTGHYDISFFNTNIDVNSPCWNTGRTFFYNVADPISNPTPSISTLSPGVGGSPVEYSTAYISSKSTPLFNPPAIGDSWTINCGNGANGGCSSNDGSCSGPIVMANMASASNMFLSNMGTFYQSVSNNDINPQSGPDIFSDYARGVGFVPATINLNPAGSTTGGLWLGLSNPNTSNQAAYVVTPAIPSINLSAYVNSQTAPGDTSNHQVTPIFGGHFTLAIGDPFIVSSYAAKTLWYLASSPVITLSSNTLTPSGMSGLIDVLVNGGSVNGSAVSSVFRSSTKGQNYLKWLLGDGGVQSAASWGSAGQAANVAATLNTAASKPIEQESIWGKISDFAIDAAIDAATLNIPLFAGHEAKIGSDIAWHAVEGTASSANGAFGELATSAIDAHFTSTVSLPAPTMSTATPYVDTTASNLLGVLLAKSFVQAAINTTVFDAPNTANALTSNYTINTTPLCEDIQVNNNLLQANCYAVDSSGALSTNMVNNNGSQATSVQSYDNVLTTAPNAWSNTQLNIWDAILTGADITTGQNYSASNNGYMVMQNIGATFSPPTQVVNASGIWPLNITDVNTTFNSTSGLVSMASYSYYYPEDTSLGSTPPRTAPSMGLVVAKDPLAGHGINFAAPTAATTAANGTYSYINFFGNDKLTDFGYQGSVTGASLTGYSCANGIPSIHMSHCLPHSSVALLLTPGAASTDASGASCALNCSSTAIVGSAGASPGPSMPVINPITPLGSFNMIGVKIDAVSTYGSNGLLTVTGYKATYSDANGEETADGIFSNGAQTLDTTTCPSGTNVALTFYPTSSQYISNPTAVGFLSCQALSLPYTLCTNDQDATGGVLAIVTGVTGVSTKFTTPVFELACACNPPYLDGPKIDSSAINFLQTGTGSDGKPVGIMIGASTRAPKQQCH